MSLIILCQGEERYKITSTRIIDESNLVRELVLLNQNSSEMVINIPMTIPPIDNFISYINLGELNDDINPYEELKIHAFFQTKEYFYLLAKEMIIRKIFLPEEHLRDELYSILPLGLLPLDYLTDSFIQYYRKKTQPQLLPELIRVTKTNNHIFTKVFKSTWLKEGIQVETYDDGKRKCIEKYVDGLKEGKEFRYHQNGKLSLLVNYFSGRKHGLEITWYESGDKHTETRFREGIMSGEFKMWHNNGILAIHCFYKNDRIHGLRTVVSNDGKRKNERNFLNGLAHGQSRIYIDNILVSKTQYQHGELVPERCLIM